MLRITEKPSKSNKSRDASINYVAPESFNLQFVIEAQNEFEQRIRINGRWKEGEGGLPKKFAKIGNEVENL